MKRFLIIFLMSILLPVYAAGDIFENIDMNFIDTAFDGIQPITNKQFNETVDKLTPQPVPDTFGGKLKAFLFGRKYGSDNKQNVNVPEVKIDIGGEKKAIEDIKNGIYYIKLLVSIVAMDGKIIPLGNYKIKEENVENQPLLVFYQGNNEYGKLPLKTFNDVIKEDSSDIAYSRVDILSEEKVRIVYSTIKDTKCAVARIYNP